MKATILNGNHLAKEVYNELQNEQKGAGLVDIVIGNNPEAHKFADIKGKKAREYGFKFEKKSLPETFPPKLIIEAIQQYNDRKNIHGIVIQLPLPKTVATHFLLKTVHPFKDVDCLHPKNLGGLLVDEPSFLPPIVLGVSKLLLATQKFQAKTYTYSNQRAHTEIPNLEGVNITLVGFGLLVGKPLTIFLLNQQATVSVVNEFSTDTKELIQKSEVIITGTNGKDVLNPNHVSEDSVVIDIGNDINTDQFVGKNIFLAKNPGGIGPLTVAYLLSNTLLATKPISNISS